MLQERTRNALPFVPVLFLLLSALVLFALGWVQASRGALGSFSLFYWAAIAGSCLTVFGDMLLVLPMKKPLTIYRFYLLGTGLWFIVVSYLFLLRAFGPSVGVLPSDRVVPVTWIVIYFSAGIGRIYLGGILRK